MLGLRAALVFQRVQQQRQQQLVHGWRQNSKGVSAPALACRERMDKWHMHDPDERRTLSRGLHTLRDLPSEKCLEAAPSRGEGKVIGMPHSPQIPYRPPLQDPCIPASDSSQKKRISYHAFCSQSCVLVWIDACDFSPRPGWQHLYTR